MVKKTDTFNQYYTALMNISRTITFDLYLEDIIKLIVMVVAKVTGEGICSLWLIDENEIPKRIRIKALHNLGAELIKSVSLNMDEGVVGAVIRDKQPLVVADVSNEPLFKEKAMAKARKLVSMASVPLLVKNGDVIGVLNCYTTTPHKFTKDEIDQLGAVADQAAVTVSNTVRMIESRAFQEELEARKLVERAKTVLMQQRDIEDDVADLWLQKRSQNSGKSIYQVADAVLLAESPG
jgi:signal transduction protein with GAF and PtsI domain